LPSDRNKPKGSLVTGKPAEEKPRAIRSLKAWCLDVLLGALKKSLMLKVKVKVGFFYSATYAAMPQPAALYNRRKWQLIGKSHLVRERKAAATTHTTAPINHTRPSPRKHSPDGAARARKQTSEYSLLLSLSTSKGWKADSSWVAGYIPK